MYELKIKTGNVWRTADISADTSIATTYEQAGIAEMSLKGNGTQQIALPITPTNCTIFGNVQSKQSSSRIQYTRMDARLYSDGLELFGDGSYCVLLSVTADAFNISVVGGSADMFTALQEIVFADDPDVLGTATRLSLNNQSAVESATGVRHMSQNYLAYELPFVPLSYIRTELQTASGFTLPETLFPSNYYLSFVSIKRNTADYTQPVAYDALTKIPNSGTDVEFLGWKINAGSPSLPTGVTHAGVRVNLVCKYNTTSYATQTFHFDLLYNGVVYQVAYAFTGTLEKAGFIHGTDIISGSTAGDVYYRNITFLFDSQKAIDDNGNIVDGVTWGTTTMSSVESDPTNVGWGTDDRTLQTGGTYVPNYPSCAYYYRMQPMFAYSGSDALAYGQMNIAENIGFANGLDLYKALAQTFCKITNVNGTTANVYSLADVVANKSSAVDWTEKIVETQDEFVADGYAQTNHIAFDEDETSGALTQYTFASPDATLEKSKTTTIAFQSANRNGTWVWTKKTDDGYDWNLPKKPYFCELSSGSLLPVASSIMSGWSSIGNRLVNWLYVTATVRLTMRDVLSFDHTIPVYLRQYGRFFYVEKIENYIINQTCTAYLVGL